LLPLKLNQELKTNPAPFSRTTAADKKKITINNFYCILIYHKSYQGTGTFSLPWAVMAIHSFVEDCRKINNGIHLKPDTSISPCNEVNNNLSKASNILIFRKVKSILDFMKES
jgi:hypothetical protein